MFRIGLPAANSSGGRSGGCQPEVVQVGEVRVTVFQLKTKHYFYILYLPKSSGSRPSSTSVHFLASSVVMASLADRSTRRAF
jgi:hypothetical protein